MIRMSWEVITVRIEVTINVPVRIITTEVEYSDSERPTGLEYIILTAVGTNGLKKVPWEEFYNKLNLYDEMLPLLEKTVENLQDKEVLVSAPYHYRDPISKMSFTDTGIEMFEKGFIKKDPKNVSVPIYHKPFSINNRFDFKYDPVSGDPDRKERFESLGYGKEDLDDFIVWNKTKIGAKREEEVLRVEVTGDKEIGFEEGQVWIDFDEITGNFTLDSPLDTNLIKGYFEMADFVTDGMFEDNPLISPEEYQDFTDMEDGFGFRLISSYNQKKELRAFDPSIYSVQNAIGIQGMGRALVHVYNGKTSEEFIPIIKETSITGLKGSSKCKMLATRNLPPDETSRIIRLIAMGTDISTIEGLDVSMKAVTLLKDRDLMDDRLLAHISTTSNVPATIDAIRKNAKNWGAENDKYMESALARLDIDDCLATANKLNIKVDGITLAEHYLKEGLDKLDVGDALFQFCKDVTTISTQLSLGDDIAAVIMGEHKGTFRSNVMKWAVQAGSDLEKLMGIFAMDKDGKYSPELIDEDGASSSGMIFGDLELQLNKLGQCCDKSQRFADILDLRKPLNELVGLYMGERPLETLTGWMLGVGARRRVEIILKGKGVHGADLNAIIDRATKMGWIAETERGVIDEIRQAGNVKVHTADKTVISVEEKDRWISVINDLDARKKPIDTADGQNPSTNGKKKGKKKRDVNNISSSSPSTIP